MVIIIEVTGQNAFEVGFVEHDDMIEALPPDRADQPFDVGILPGRPRRGKHFLDAYTLQAFPQSSDRSASAVANQVTRRLVKGEGLADLAGYPFRGWMRCHVEVGDASPIVAQHEETIEQPKRGRGHDKEIDGGQAIGVIGEEGT